MNDKLLKELSNTSLYERLVKIREMYHKLEKKQIKFTNEFDIHCLKGCGKCCENFTPDITEAEADFLAYGLIKEGKDEEVLNHLMNDKTSDHYCPLYIKDSVYHCSCYKWRPLVCRLFNASASTDKFGNPVYRKCKWNESGKDLTSEEFLRHKKYVVMMNEYGDFISSLEPDDTNRDLISDALIKSINKIRYLIELEEASNK